MSSVIDKFVLQRPGVQQRSALSSTSTVNNMADRFRGISFAGGHATERGASGSSSMMTSVQASASSNVPSSNASGDSRRRTNISRSDLIRQACELEGFAQDSSELTAVAGIVTAVRASNASGYHLQSKSIGAPASTSLLADPGQLVTTTPTGLGDAFKIFFGEGQFPFKSDYDISDQDVFTLPQAYQGQAIPRISETIEQLVYLEGNWYQQVVAPIELTNALAIKWSQWEFNPHLADVVPELGVNRLVNSRRLENSARFVRRGIGFMLEHGFMLTPEGITHYLMNINQLVQAAVETNKFDLIHTLLGSHDQNKSWLVSNGLFSGKRVEDVYKRGELFYWDIIKKEKNGLALLDTRISEEMNRWRGEADTWIVHPDIPDFLTQRPAENTDYFIAGAAGPQTLRDGPDAFTSFRGNQIFKTRAYHVDENDPVDIMRFPAQIGEHHWMTDRYPECMHDIDYQSCFRDVQIYDEDNDQFARISLISALEYSNRFDTDTGAVLSFQQRGYLERYSDDELANDVLHYRDAKGRIQTVTYFANVKSQHLSAKSRLALGETVKQRLKGIRGADRADALLASVRTAIAQMESYDWNQDTEAYLNTIAGGLGGVLDSFRTDRPGGNAPLFDLKEYDTNVTSGSNALPQNAAGDPAGGLLPPGFQSLEGIKEIVSKWRSIKGNKAQIDASLFRNVSTDLLNDLEAFVDFFEQIVRKLKTFFPDSELLNARNASSWWQRPTSGTVLFNNVVHKYRVPLWYQGAAGAGQDTSDAAAQNINQNKLGQAAISGIQSFVQPILATATRVLGTATNGGPPNVRRVLDYLDDAGTQVPLADANGNYPDTTKLGIRGLARTNFQQFLPSVWNVLVVATLIGQLSNANDQKVLDAKLAKIETDIVGAFYANNDAVTKQVDNMGGLFQAIKKLSATKSRKDDVDMSPFFVNDGFNSLKDRLMTIYQRLESIGASDRSANDLINSDGTIGRTTLLAAPKLLRGLADALAAGNTPTWLPSNPAIPDLVISVDDLIDQASKSQSSDDMRAPAFIDYELLSTMGSLSARQLAEFSTNFEFVQTANAVEYVNRQFPGMLNENFESSSIQSMPSISRNIASSMMDDDVEFIGDDETTADVARGHQLLVDDARSAAVGARPSRAGLSQGFSHFFKAREALEADSARENFALLSEADTDSWAYIFASVFNYAPVNLSQLRSIIKNDILFPFNFLLSRPHARYQCDYMIKLKRGSETVSTYQRRGRFEVGDDVNIGAHVGHYRYCKFINGPIGSFKLPLFSHFTNVS